MEVEAGLEGGGRKMDQGMLGLRIRVSASYQLNCGRVSVLVR